MISKEEVEQTLESYEKLVTRAQHVYNRLYTELYTKYGKYHYDMEHELFRGIESGYDMHIKRADEPENIGFGTSDSDRDGDYIGYCMFKKEFLYDDEALTAYIKSETEKNEEEQKRKREAEAEKHKRDAEKKEAEERALYEKLKAKYGDN
jgi:hypothetical protein